MDLAGGGGQGVAEIIIENHCISPTKKNTYTQIHTLYLLQHLPYYRK
jgi:hypothetical protein